MFKKQHKTMKQFTLIFSIIFLICSCNITPNNNYQLLNSHPKRTIKEPDHKEPGDTCINSIDTITKLSDVFHNAVKVFPDDSASLYNFYYEWFPAKKPEKIKEQIVRLQTLTTKESINRYNKVVKKLKPLLIQITKTDSISKSQAYSLVILYSDYDHFSGEALFSQLLTEDDNYNLVWKSFRIMAKESQKDTCYISALISLSNHIRTNVELSEAMPEFVVKAIRNNPTGFLEMYGAGKNEQRIELAKYIAKYDEPDKKLVEIYTDISNNSKNRKYKELAKDLLLKIND